MTLPVRFTVANCWIDAIEREKAADPAAFDINTLCEKSPYGIKARPQFAQELRSGQLPEGKLLLPLRVEDIAERNGEGGKPLWIIVGNDVFDITSKSCNVLY